MAAKQTVLLNSARHAFHAALLAGPLTIDDHGIPAIADKGNGKSIALAKFLVELVGTAEVKAKVAGQRSGGKFEDAVVDFLKDSFPQLSHIRPGKWGIEKGGGAVSRFEQLNHLAEIASLLKEHPKVKASIAVDYLIAPDIVISRLPERDQTLNKRGPLVAGSIPAHSPLRAKNNKLPILHATISCKWTIRSDRVQNTRTEAQNLIRNRKGRVPHIVAVTAEPLPSRISAIALGTADLDCVYHFALPELIKAHKKLGYDDDMLDIMVKGKRLRDISDLPLDLAV